MSPVSSNAMNNTPRLRSAFPSSPGTGQKQKEQNGSKPGSCSSSPPSLNPVPSTSDTAEPTIPFEIIDAPSQRLYILFFYLGLTVWRLADYFRLVSDETDSLWLFMKWVAIDSVFLYGLPGLKVPWLQWSPSTITVLFIFHAVLNAVLMFRIPIPVATWVLAGTKLIYDRELAIAEISVKPASILHNSSLILGKQIIHILPEGSAMLNPEQRFFCLGETRTSVNLPIRINQTSPILIQLLRIDLDTNLNETITITGKELKKLKKQANRAFPKIDYQSPRFLEYPVKETGLYRLLKVVDESKLEVQRRLSDTLVVPCPSASVTATPQNKCKGELSDFYLQVQATPPFKIKYSKIVNKEDTGNVVLTIHPENLVSPLARQNKSGLLVSLDSASVDVSWARPRSVKVPLNESLGISGHWQYWIDEVQDACGNVVDYTASRREESFPNKSKRKNQLGKTFTVHERPQITLDGYSSQRSLKVQRGKSYLLPVRLSSTGSDTPEDARHTITYAFTPESNLTPNQQHAADPMFKKLDIGSNDSGFQVSEPGLYSLEQISTDYCSGEILEPSSCLLQNPPEPDLKIYSQEIPDNCAGKSIGLLVDLHLIGTPPFTIAYNIRHAGRSVTPRILHTDRLQSQLELRPSEAGKYTYEFLQISDAVYKNPRSLPHELQSLKQDVKPPASAKFENQYTETACMDEPVMIGIIASGEGPWKLEYEIFHNGRRQEQKSETFEDEKHTIVTSKLMAGGDYSLLLTSITDKSGCKVLLDQQAKIQVPFQKPQVAFGQIDGKRSISAVEGSWISLPLRLQGEAPFVTSFRNLDAPQADTTLKFSQGNNDQVNINVKGTYEIVSVQDISRCSGLVDQSAKQFKIRWISRPTITVAESSLVKFDGGKYIRKGICKGDEDATEISFSGTAPYTVEYAQKFKPNRGSNSKRYQKLTAGLSLASFKMEASESGLYEYEFSQLGDSAYNQAAPGSILLTVQQEVYPNPSARFAAIGKSYKYCKEEKTGDEVIPIILSGQPPFSLEVHIRHHATAKPEIINIPHIDINRYNFHIPHRVLALGTHAVTIRKVRDSRGCQEKLDLDAPHVQVSVADIPSITPLEARTDFCVGDRISYTLSGSPPFKVFYTFQNLERKATVPLTTFKRIAEKPGEFKITGVSDQRSTENCKARTEITKIVHEMPSVRISKGRTATADIHEGGEVEIFFEFGGTPPFEFTYTRSTNPLKGKKSEILETKSDISNDYVKTIRASDEGVYEVVSIKDRFCSFSTQKMKGKAGQKLLTYY